MRKYYTARDYGPLFTLPPNTIRFGILITRVGLFAAEGETSCSVLVGLGILVFHNLPPAKVY